MSAYWTDVKPWKIFSFQVMFSFRINNFVWNFYFRRVYDFSNLAIDRAPMIRKIFVYWRKHDGAEKVCACRRNERGWDGRRLALRSVTNGFTGPSSSRITVKCISRTGVTIAWMSARYRARPISNSSAGFSMLSGLVSHTILQAHYARYLLYRLSYENNIVWISTVICISACTRIFV